ncbi:HNH endonuclease [Candidatus Pacearchaeota archaeon]|nr:HNH endonuclease [Candidatus Pacearchaeota archaeon]
MPRAMYTANNGEIPKGFIIRHSCDNGMCVNPNHLLLGTKKDNTQDMLKRNRESKWKGGRENHRSDKRRKLSLDQVEEIKNSGLSSYRLAEIYPVSSTQVRRIRNGSRCKSLG